MSGLLNLLTGARISFHACLKDNVRYIIHFFILLTWKQNRYHWLTPRALEFSVSSYRDDSQSKDKDYHWKMLRKKWERVYQFYLHIICSDTWLEDRKDTWDLRPPEKVNPYDSTNSSMIGVFSHPVFQCIHFYLISCDWNLKLLRIL